MTERQRQEFQRAHDRIARLEPELLVAVMSAFRTITNGMREAELARLISQGALEHLVNSLILGALFERATKPLRAAIRNATGQSFKLNTPYLPRGGMINGEIAIRFDYLNPRVLDAIRTLETRTITTLRESIRDTVRQHVLRGFQEQTTPRTIARGLREVIGLAPNQEQAVANFERMLRAGDREALTRTLRDKRFDATLRKSLSKDGPGLSAEQVNKMTAAYRKRMTAFHAETVSRTATLESYKIGQRESWAAAVEEGIVDRDRAMRQWIGVNDGRERDSHVEMNDTVVPFDSPYPNGQSYPGEGEYNCRCVDRFFVARAA